MSDEDEKRAKQLEEARKRVEELKNKKKKKGKKKKATTEITAETETNDDDSHIDNDETSESKAENATPGVDETDSSVVGTQNQVGSEEEDIKPTDEQEEQEETTPVENITAETSGSTSENAEEIPAEVSDIKENVNADEPDTKESSEVAELFSNDDEEPDFLTKLQKEKEHDQIKTLNEQVESLNAQLKKLKFLNLEQETTIEELQEKVHELETKNRSTELELLSTRQQLEHQMNPQGYTQQPNVEESHNSPHLTTFASQSVVSGMLPTRASDQSTFSPLVDRALINEWKGWNLDMTSWRSIGSGELIQF